MVTAKHQTLPRKFEGLFMKEFDIMHDYVLNMSNVVNQIRKSSEGLNEQKVVREFSRVGQKKKMIIL